MRRLLYKARRLLGLLDKAQQTSEDLKMLLGTLLSQAVVAKQEYASLADLEFKVFSQFGDDGIIQYLATNLDLRHRTFVEFGVQDYLESNTRFLLQRNNWAGFVMDSSGECIERLKSASFFWKHDLEAHTAFVTRENIRDLLQKHTGHWDGIDLLHIDLDGNDYWIWREIEVQPAIVIVEYNSIFGLDRAITIPYRPDFQRSRAHFSHLYWGSSLKALHTLALRKGYSFIGCNSAGNNAYFIRRDAMNAKVVQVSLEQGYVRSRYRESRDREGRLNYLGGAARTASIRGLPVYDIESDEMVPF
jgi:hypothetical protein